MALLHVKQLYAGSVTTGTPQTKYTVPAGYRAKIRSVACQNEFAGSQGVIFYVSGLEIFFHNFGAVHGGSDSFEWTPQIVLEPGDTFEGKTGSGLINIIVSGFLYTI